MKFARAVCAFAGLALLLLPGCSSGEPDARPYASRYAGVDNLRLETLTRAEARELALELSPRAQGLRSWKDLSFALKQSLDYVLSRPEDGNALILPGRNPLRLDWRDLRFGLERLLEILPYLDINTGLLADEFIWLRLSPEFGFTAYYEPTLEVDYQLGPIYRYPLYAPPPDMKPGVPYHDRRAIDRWKVLSGRGLEIAWARDMLDVFFLQIQGSGRLVFTDGREKYALYAGKNGHPYVSLGRELLDRGLLSPDRANMPGIREVLAANPEQMEDLLALNPSYVFFRLENSGLVGGMGRLLTPGVSLAVDPAVLPYGSLLFFQTVLPDSSGGHTRDFRALGLPQDRGGAIRGRRVDLFLGGGEQAGHVAGHLNSEGVVYLLLPVSGGSFTRDFREASRP
ncbi:MAG: MltA domain-containing protein [Deltaproteobacteria bacterium]|nr:MltA domain-containing protein [Deltaproteobacteria bacterium]